MNGTSLNLGAYAAYSPIYLSTTFFIGYLLIIALAVAAVVEFGLLHGRPAWTTIRSGKQQDPDVHFRLIQAYPQVPNW